MDPSQVKPAYSIDERRFPLVVGRPTDNVGDPEALAPNYATLERLLAQGKPFAILLDLRGSASSPKRRQRMADWSAKHDAAIRQLLLASAVIVGSQIERGFVTAAMWLATPPIPVRVFTNDPDAEAWLLEMCRERGAL